MQEVLFAFLSICILLYPGLLFPVRYISNLHITQFFNSPLLNLSLITFHKLISKLKPLLPLNDDGTLFVHIDDANLAYITIVLDEVFGRSNRLYLITFKQGAATGC